MSDDHRPNLNMATPDEIADWLQPEPPTPAMRLEILRHNLEAFVAALGFRLFPYVRETLEKMAAAQVEGRPYLTGGPVSRRSPAPRAPEPYLYVGPDLDGVIDLEGPPVRIPRRSDT